MLPLQHLTVEQLAFQFFFMTKGYSNFRFVLEDPVNIKTATVTNKIHTAKTAEPKTVAAEVEANKPEAAAPEESFKPQAKDESRGSAAWRGGVRKGVAWGNKIDKPVSYMTGAVGAVTAGIAMSTGGAIAGAALGGAAGPALAALTSNGVLDFVGSSFSTFGTAVAWGSAAGAVLGVVGGAVLGYKAGDTVANAVAMPLGFAVGAVQGAANPESIPPASKEPEQPEQRTELRGAFRGAGQVLGGFGGLSGVAGGFVTGAALTAGASLISDVAAGDFSLSSFTANLGGSAFAGGLVGAAALGIVGGYGGQGIAKAGQFGWDKTAGKALKNQPGIKDRIAKTEVELEAREGELRNENNELINETQAYRKQHKEISTALDQREDSVKADETRVASDLQEINTRIENNATADFDKRSATADPSLDANGNHGIIGERSSLDSWDAKLTGWQGDLDKFRGELKSWEKNLDGQIDREAAAIFGEERKPIDQHFAGLHSQLDGFEGKLDNYEKDILSRIESKRQSGIAAQKPGVDSELRSAQNDKSSSENELRNARNERENAQSRLDSAERSRSSARSRYNSAVSEGNTLSSRISSLNSRISRLESDLSRCRSSL